MQKPFHTHKRAIDIFHHFTPNWFAMTMGTGITAICLNALSPLFPILTRIATGIWMWNILLFILFSLMFLIRIVFYPASWKRMMQHSSQALFLGCIPMGLATIINGWIYFGIPYLGHSAIRISSILWYIDVILSIASSLVVPQYMFTQHTHSLKKMSALWLLPFVACEVAAASGGLLIPYLPSEDALQVLIISLALWAVSVSLALSILVIYFQRLSIHKLPPLDIATSVWLPLGPTATGAVALLLLGNNSQSIHIDFSSYISTMIQILPGIGLLGGIILWALASWWFFIAIFASFSYHSQKIHFNMGFWAYTFPLGVYTMANFNLANQTHLAFFQNFFIFLTCMLSLIWIYVTLYTLKGAYQGHLFKDPTLD